MSLVRWRPFRELNGLTNEFDRLFDNFLNIKRMDTELMPFEWAPVTNIREDDGNYFVDMEIPGMKKDEIKISFKDGLLNISGERKEEKEKKDKYTHFMERHYGSFCRSFSLPYEVKEDKIDANYKDGILKVVLPKTEEVKVKEIAIK